MKIRVKVDDKMIAKMTAEYVREIENKLIRVLKYTGEQCVNIAREQGSYQDRTGNLRASSGYVIVHNGEIVERSTFEIKESQKLAEEVANRITSRIALIVVAGMNYAAYVEARGYNVLTSSEQFAEVQVPKLLKQLKINYNHGK